MKSQEGRKGFWDIKWVMEARGWGSLGRETPAEKGQDQGVGLQSVFLHLGKNLGWKMWVLFVFLFVLYFVLLFVLLFVFLLCSTSR